MAIGTQLVKIYRTSDGLELYRATAIRNTDLYPLTSAGQAAFEVAASAGYFTLTVDNGAIIPAGMQPPLTKPGPNNGAAFLQKIQAEDATGTGGFTGQSGDNNLRGPYSTSNDYLLYQITGASASASNYNLAIRYQTSTQTTGLATLIVNTGSPVDFPIEGTDGGIRTYNATIVLNAGTNSIRIQGKSGTSFFMDYIVITRAAG